ncbi:MAG TPA: flagellar protein FlaG [Bacillales bacterium]|nr:flagellar protein FlaG [Bacillales bacterium]
MIEGSKSTTTAFPRQQIVAPVDGAKRGNQIKDEQKTAPAVNFEQKLDQHDPKQKEKIKQIVKGLNEFLNPAHTSIKFKLHEKLNEYYVTVVDDSTNEVVREIPSKKLLDMYADMTERLGILVDKKI